MVARVGEHSETVARVRFRLHRVSSEVLVPLVLGAVGIASLIFFSRRMAQVGRTAHAAGHPRPKAVMVFWIALAVALIGYAVFVVAALLN